MLDLPTATIVDVKRVLLLFILQFCFSLAQDINITSTQDLLDIRAKEEVVLQGLARAVNLDVRPCGINHWRVMSWPGIVICGITPLTSSELKEKATSFMVTEKHASTDNFTIWREMNENLWDGGFRFLEGDYSIIQNSETGFAVLFFYFDNGLIRRVASVDSEVLDRTRELAIKEQINSLMPQIKDFIFSAFGVQPADFVGCDNFSESPSSEQSEATCVQTLLTLDEVQNTLPAIFMTFSQSPLRPVGQGLRDWVVLEDGAYFSFSFDIVPFTLRFIDVADGERNVLILYHSPLE